ncbi:MAG TPA: MlaD family protein [Burkholderiaceae bacterium]
MKLSIEARARLLFAALVIAGVAGFAGWRASMAARFVTYELRTSDPVSGLIVDAPVEFHGVEVGQVARIELAGRRAVRVLLRVRRDAPVTRGTVATIAARGLAARGFTGYVVVELEDAGTDPQPPVAAPGEAFARLRVAPSTSVNVDTAIGEVDANVRALTALLQSALDPATLAALRESIDNLRRVSATLAANGERLDSILRRVDRASAQVGPLLTSGRDTARSLQGRLVPDAEHALERIDRLSGTLDDVATRVDRDPALLLRGGGRRPLGPGEAR